MQSCPDNVPFEVLDADFFAGLLVVIEPLSLCQLYTLKLGIRVNPVRQPLSLTTVSTICNVYLEETCNEPQEGTR